MQAYICSVNSHVNFILLIVILSNSFSKYRNLVNNKKLKGSQKVFVNRHIFPGSSLVLVIFIYLDAVKSLKNVHNHVPVKSSKVTIAIIMKNINNTKNMACQFDWCLMRNPVLD